MRALQPPSELREAVHAATSCLAAAGVPSPRHDAEALAAYVLGVGRAELIRHHLIGPAYDELVARRAQRVPLQHLVGTAAFRHLEVAVGPGVFVPRPETEVVAGWAIDALRGARAPVVVDLCTGSGVIALAIAQEVPGAVVHAVEQSAAAVRWARRNVEESALPVVVHHGGAAAALVELSGAVDLVVSNPPYLPEGESVDPEVREHDPAVALWAGVDGLDVIRDVVAAARRLLRPGGWLVVEHGDHQGELVPALLAPDAWSEVHDHADLTGRARFATARRTSSVAP